MLKKSKFWRKKIEILESSQSNIKSRFTKLKNECKELKSQYNVRNVNKREIWKKEKIEMLLEENSLLEDSIENLKNKIEEERQKIWCYKKKAYGAW